MDHAARGIPWILRWQVRSLAALPIKFIAGRDDEDSVRSSVQPLVSALHILVARVGLSADRRRIPTRFLFAKPKSSVGGDRWVCADRCGLVDELLANLVSRALER